MKRPQSLKVGASAQLVPILIGYGANVLATPYVVVKLGLADFGLWAVTGALAQYGVLLDFGVSRSVVRFVAVCNAKGNREEESSVVGLSVLIVTAMGGVLFLLPCFLATPLNHLIHSDDVRLTRTLFESSIVLLTTGLLGVVFSGASIGRGRMVLANVGLGLQRATVVAGGVIALIGRPSLAYFAIGSAIGGAVGLVLLLLLILVDEGRIVIGAPRTGITREFIAFSLKAQVMTVSDLLGSQLGKLLAGILIGPTAAGAYELGSRLALGAKAFSSSPGAVVSSQLSRDYASRGVAGVRAQYARLVQRYVSVGNFWLLALAATSISVVPAWLDTDNRQIVTVVLVLSVVFTVNVVTGVPASAAVALNEIGVLVFVNITGWIMALAFEIAGGIMFGLVGILAGMALAVSSNTLLAVFLINQRIGAPLGEFFAALRGPFILGLITTAPAFAFGAYFMPSTRSSALFPLLCSAILFTTSYVALGWRLNYLPRVTGFKFRSWKRHVRPSA